MEHEEYDFTGWATRNDIKCADGRTIRNGAFKHNNGQVVPLVWMHKHDDPLTVLGHALLEDVPEEGVRTYGKFNSTPQGQAAREYVKNGDVTSLSIYANHLQQDHGNVLHGDIREVSLVLAGANPGAYIDNVLVHTEDGLDDEAVIYTGESIDLFHDDVNEEKQPEDKATEEEPALEHAAPEEKEKEMAEGKEKTIGEIVETMTEEQKQAMYALIGLAQSENNKEGETNMKHNVFDNDNEKNTLSHADMEEIFKDAKRLGSLKEAVLSHSEELAHAVTYGIEDIDTLFPEPKLLNNPPEFIKRDTGWVSTVMSGVHHSPFSRIKSQFADITEDDARAKGYIKGNLKKEEFFGLIKRTTTPTTVYKKQKLDRDDVIDITDFDVVAWLKGEMRLMLDEELARAYLFGDGRDASSDDKINPINIRPAAFDDDLYTIKVMLDDLSDPDAIAKNFIKKVIKSRKNYKGSGNPILFTTEDMLTDMLLIEDTTGREIYADEAALARKLRVSKIVTCEVMENMTGINGGALLGVLLNLSDYNVGADKGGAVSMFDDFDIDYNQQKYLIETRCSGALTKPYSCIEVEAYHA